MKLIIIIFIFFQSVTAFGKEEQVRLFPGVLKYLSKEEQRLFRKLDNGAKTYLNDFWSKDQQGYAGAMWEDVVKKPYLDAMIKRERDEAKTKSKLPKKKKDDPLTICVEGVRSHLESCLFAISPRDDEESVDNCFFYHVNSPTPISRMLRNINTCCQKNSVSCDSHVNALSKENFRVSDPQNYKICTHGRFKKPPFCSQASPIVLNRRVGDSELIDVPSSVDNSSRMHEKRSEVDCSRPRTTSDLNYCSLIETQRASGR